MKQEENFIKKCCNFGYSEDLSRFDRLLDLENLHSLVTASRICVPVLLLFSVVLSGLHQLSARYTLPFLAASIAMATLSFFVWEVIKRPLLEEDPIPKPGWRMLLFSVLLFTLAFYDTFYLQPDRHNIMLCFAFVTVGMLFHVSLLWKFGFLCGVLLIFLGLSYAVRGAWLFTSTDIDVVLAAALGLLLGWQRSNGTISALLALEREKTDRIRAEEAKAMISQLQPHFLYNTLASIQYLCTSDQDRAHAALGQFCQVMRGNMDSISHRSKIPFAWELEHTKNYVDLEQLRFGNRLTIRYNIQIKDFMIPALTLQSVVENAIKHGVCNRKDGGIIIVNCKLNGKWVEITVTDNGSLQDRSNYRWQDRWEDCPNHVGLQTVQDRLQAVMEGDLVLQYLEGVGSIVTVRVRKEEVKRYADSCCR